MTYIQSHTITITDDKPLNILEQMRGCALERNCYPMWHTIAKESTAQNHHNSVFVST